MTMKNSTCRIKTMLLLFMIFFLEFLKMDCEGAEYEALLGLDETTCAKIRTISIEFHDLKDKRLNSYHLAGFLQKRDFIIVRHEFLKTVARVNTGHLVAVQK